MSFHIENDIIKKSHPNLKTVWYATAGWRNEIFRCVINLKQKTKDLATRNPLKRQWTQVLWKGNSSCTHRVTLVCPLSFMTQIFCNRKLSYGGDQYISSVHAWYMFCINIFWKLSSFNSIAWLWYLQNENTMSKWSLKE
jgi:hypothetical protein